MKRISVSLHGHRTSVSLEPEFWTALQALARQDGRSVAGLIQTIDDARLKDGTSGGQRGGLSSALRVYVLNRLREQGRT